MSKEYKLTSQDFYKSEDLIPKTVIDSSDPVYELKRLSGINPTFNRGQLREYKDEQSQSINMSHTAQEKIDYQKKHNIKPGTPEWFRLWFSLPKFMGGETPW